MIHEVREEILERIFTLREQGKKRLGDVEAILGDAIRVELDGLVADGLVAVRGDEVDLTARGDDVASGIVRRHRLAERLLVDLFELNQDAMEEGACAFEHALSAEVTASVCALLGHPPVCPHGRAIPRGECCTARTREIEPVVTRLSDLQIGNRARIVFIAPRFVDRINRLAGLGLVAGSVVRLSGRHPACVVDVGETALALDREIAREIFVKRVAE